LIGPWGLLVAGGWYLKGCPQWLVVGGNGEEPGGWDEAEDVWCCCCCCFATMLANYDMNDGQAKNISFANLPKKDFANPGGISSQSFQLRYQNH